MGRLHAAVITAVLAITLVLVSVSTAQADITVFIGTNTVPSARQAIGAALGLNLLGIGIEVEYCETSHDESSLAPELTTAMGNILLQSPVKFLRMQPYLTGGAGVYRETLDLHQDTDVAYDVGGGVKANLLGPLQLRADYRWIKLGSGALDSPAHRFYVGVTLPF